MEGQEPVVQEENQKVPLGFTARTDKPISITSQQFFDLMRVLDGLNNVVNFVKQENINNDNIRYYFEEDLVHTEEDGKKVSKLRDDFWDPKIIDF